MLKAAGSILVIFSCAALGYSKSLALSKRLWQLQEIQKMVLLLSGEIAYRREALPEAMERVAEKMKEPLSGFLKEVSHTACLYEGERFSEIFSKKAEVCFKNSSLSKKDLESFAQLGEYLGYLDLNMQKNTISLYLEEVRQAIQEISRELPVKGRLYQSMGILGGIFLAILLV